MFKPRGSRTIRPQALRTGGKREYGDYSRSEIVSMIAQLYYTDGVTQERIADMLKVKGVDFDRNAIADCLREARELGRLRYVPPLENTLAAFIADRNPQLHEVSVVETAEPKQVGRKGADLLLTLLCRHKKDTGQDEAHVGFAGGKTPNLMAQALAELLVGLESCSDADAAHYPQHIFFYSLVGAVNFVDASIDPNSFFIYFAIRRNSLEGRHFQLRFINLPLPGLSLRKEVRRIANLKAVLGSLEMTRDVVDPAAMARRLDFLVTSCGHWGIGCKSFVDHISLACDGFPALQAAWEKTIGQLERKGVIGDIGWCPLGAGGPIDEKTELRIEKLFGIRELAWFAHPKIPAGNELLGAGGKVILLAGPCSGCRQSKGKLLRSILALDPPPLTHLVADTRTADDYRFLIEREG